MKGEFVKDVGVLVAMMVLVHRDVEAAEIARLARADLDDPALHSVLDEALKGVMPPIR